LELISAAFSFLQRKFDAMLFWLALFAILYGQRLWLQSNLLSLMVPPTIFFSSLKDSCNYLVPIPAFFYFEASGFLGRYGRKIGSQRVSSTSQPNKPTSNAESGVLSRPTITILLS
jgi:sigma-B regulation protein RsbU (phosphoserine phosphatase)